MAPYRPSSTRESRRSGRAYAEHDILEGIPVRQWQRQSITMGVPSKPETPSDARNLQKELPMPKEAHMLSPMSQALLQAARAGYVHKPSTSAPEDESKTAAVEIEEEKDTEKGFAVKKWTLVPRSLEGPEPEYLAKKRKGLIAATEPDTIQIAQSDMRRAKVKKIDADGNEFVEEVVVAPGQAVEGTIIEETAVTENAAPGTIVEGVGVINAEGMVVVDSSLAQNTPQRKRPRPPPPRRKPKGPGRGRKKKVQFAPGEASDPTLGVAANALSTNEAGVASAVVTTLGASNQSSISVTGDQTDGLKDPQGEKDVMMGEADGEEEGDEDDDEGEDGEDGEEGDEADDAEDVDMADQSDEAEVREESTKEDDTGAGIDKSSLVKASSPEEPESPSDLPLYSLPFSKPTDDAVDEPTLHQPTKLASPTTGSLATVSETTPLTELEPSLPPKPETSQVVVTTAVTGNVDATSEVSAPTRPLPVDDLPIFNPPTQPNPQPLPTPHPDAVKPSAVEYDLATSAALPTGLATQPPPPPLPTPIAAPEPTSTAVHELPIPEAPVPESEVPSSAAKSPVTAKESSLPAPPIGIVLPAKPPVVVGSAEASTAPDDDVKLSQEKGEQGA